MKAKVVIREKEFEIKLSSETKEESDILSLFFEKSNYVGYSETKSVNYASHDLTLRVKKKTK